MTDEPQEPPNWTPDTWIRQRWNDATGEPEPDDASTSANAEVPPPEEPLSAVAESTPTAEPREPEAPAPAREDVPTAPAIPLGGATTFQAAAQPQEPEDPLRALYRQQRARKLRRRVRR